VAGGPRAIRLAASGGFPQPPPVRPLRPPMKPRPLLLLAAACLLAGCSTLTTHVEPKSDVGGLRHVFVVTNLNDNHSLDQLIVRELRSHGLQAESGPITLMPTDAKAYLNYDDRWDPDFTNHLVSIGLTLREANSDRLLAMATYFRPTIFQRAPLSTVRTAVAALLKARPPPPAAAAGRPDRPHAEGTR